VTGQKLLKEGAEARNDVADQLGLSLASRFEKFSFKNEQSSTDEYSEIAKRWKDKMAMHGHSLSEKYANGRIAFVCDLHASLSRRNHQSASVSDSPFWNRECFASFVYVADIADKLQLHMGDEELMFVHNVETVKLPDGISAPSLVGLYGLHDVVDNPLGGLTFQSVRDGSFKIIPCLVHRKGHILRPLASDGEFNIAHGEVESAPEIVNSIARNAHQVSRNRFTRHEFERIASCISFTLHSDSVSMITDELKDAKLEVFEVLSGPLNL
jgi:hypothetical protein